MGLIALTCKLHAHHRKRTGARLSVGLALLIDSSKPHFAQRLGPDEFCFWRTERSDFTCPSPVEWTERSMAPTGSGTVGASVRKPCGSLTCGKSMFCAFLFCPS